MKKLLNIVGLTTGLGALFYVYGSYKTYTNYSDYVTELKQRQKLGSLAHTIFPVASPTEIEQITNQLKTGDNLFIRYDYSQALTARHYWRGFIKAFWRLKSEYDSYGYVYKNNGGTYVLYNEFGETKVKKYEDFVDLPYLKTLLAQKNHDKIDFQTKLREMVEKVPGAVDMETIQEQQVDMANRINRYLYENSYKFYMDIRLLLNLSEENIPIKTRRARIIEAITKTV